MKRSDEIFAVLEFELAALKQGDALPSIRELMRRFKCSQASVEKALQQLDKSGCIQRRWGSGIFVSPGAHALKTRRGGGVLVLVPDVSRRAYALLIRGAEEAAREKGVRLSVQSYGENLQSQTIVADALSGLILNSRTKDVDNGVLLKFLSKLPSSLPVVLVDNDVPERKCSFVGLNDYDAGLQAGILFKQRGIKRLACLVSSLSRPDQARLAGLETSFGRMPDMVIDYPQQTSLDRAALRRMALSDYDGFFIGKPDCALQTLCYLEALRINVPQSLFVISIAEEEDASLYPFPIPTIVKPTEQSGKEAIHVLLATEVVAKRLPYRVATDIAS